MYKLPILKQGDSVEIIAPASRCSDQSLIELKQLLVSWQLNCIVNENIFGKDKLFANTDAMRFQMLKSAFENPTTKAVICARGGYGSMRLIPQLVSVMPPALNKLFVGMSDITALNLFLQQKWHWPVVHGAPIISKFSPESIIKLKAILFGEVQQIEFSGLPLNQAAKENIHIDSSMTGGNLCLIQASIGTFWQLEGKNKIIFIEEVSERGYRIDRMLEHLRQAGIFHGATAIVFGDFTEGEEPDGSSLIESVLESFAQSCDIPVIQIKGVGHDYINFPLPLGTMARLQLGSKIKLLCSR